MRREAKDTTNDHYSSAEGISIFFLLFDLMLTLQLEMILSMFARSSSNRNNQLSSSGSQKVSWNNDFFNFSVFFLQYHATV